MSITSAEPIISTAPPDANPRRPSPQWRVSLKWVALALACFWIVDIGISLLIQHTGLKRALTSRLEAVFGRPVEVERYSVSLWTGPVLEADNVTVGEDPRFGNEYFLRAESLTLRIRWRSLFSRHLELATISLSHPSLNLVRDADGDWNLAEWLPRPARSPGWPAIPTANRSFAYPLRFRQINIDGGRIDFKRGDIKLPFAFVDVGGTLETESPGLWRLDLVAVPSRAAVIVQQPGVLHLIGHLGGTSSRLRPAAFELAWDGASITDVLRLARNHDYGLRGNFGLSVSVRAPGDSWLLQGKAYVTQVHRWNLALRPDNPGVNLVASGRLDQSGSRLELTQARIEMPHSNARVIGALDWTLPGPGPETSLPQTGSAKNTQASHALQAKRNAAKRDAAGSFAGTQLRIFADAVDLADALAWARAFHPGIADGTAVHGSAQIDLNFAGWPPRLQTAGFNLPRAEWRDAHLRGPARLGPVVVRYDQKRGIELAPTTITAGVPSNSLRIDGSAKPDVSSFTVHVQGASSQLSDAAAAASQLGWNLTRGWDIAGPARCDLRWQGTVHPWHTNLSGSIEWGTPAAGASLRPHFLNLPVEQLRAHSDFKTGVTHTIVSSAQAFGAHWTGTLDHDLSDGWQFAVSGDSLSAADLDRWLNPRWRESFLDRMLPFLNSGASLTAASDGIRARGRLSLDQFTLARVVLHRLRGDLIVNGRHLDFSNLDAQFDRGEAAGSLQADLLAIPKYDANFDFSDIDLHALSAEFPALTNVFAGSATAKAAFNLHGTSRGDLIDSLECRGTVHVNDAALDGFNLVASIRALAARSGASSFHDASAGFSCAEGKIQFQDLLLSAANSAWQGTGTVDYARNLDLRLHAVPTTIAGGGPAKLAVVPGEEYRITGMLDSPQISRIALPAQAANERP